MTPEEVALAGDILRRLGHPPERAARFTGQIVARDPMPPLGVEIVQLVALVEDVALLEERARSISERARDSGVRAEHYRVVRSMLAGAVGGALGPEFGPSEAVAWDRATALVAEVLQAP